MKIGIITIQKCGNFGADLQAYALGAKLRKMGYEAENIDYLFYKHPRHLSCAKEAPVLPLSMVNRIKERVFPIISWLRDRKGGDKTRAARREKFDKWFLRNVRCGEEYRSVQSLYDNPPKYDVYMVGSDQVWNPRLGSNILPYFLDFAPEGARCVSYASSIGVSELSTPAFLSYRKWLKKFSHIGLREARGVELIKRMKLDAEVQQCVDPTLLLTAEEWDEVSESVPGLPEKYLLLYDLIACPETVAIAKEMAKKDGLQIVRIGDGAYGPGEFIWLFAHASKVVTNSFHGTVFSILHHRDFATVIPKTMGNASRMTSLLESLGLEKRLVDARRYRGIADLTNGIDFGEVERRLEELRAKSLDFLTRAIAGEKRIAAQKKIGQKPLECYAVWNPDSAIRAKSTSGGAFTLLAQTIIKRGGVVYGAAFDEDFKHVHHIAAETEAELEPLRKSKYVWSDATEAIRAAIEELKKGREVLFTGCPCQCYAMKAAAKDCDEHLLTVDFVCHGAPKPEIFEAYANELEARHKAKLTRYEFRNKDKGWNFQNIYYEFDNGDKCRVLPWLDSFFHGFSVNAFLRKGCYACPFATLERVSDITIADCWRVAASHPQWDDNKGTSLVLANSEKGKKWLHDSKANALPGGGGYPLELAEKRNSALMQPAARFGFEDAFCRVFESTHSFEAASAAYMTRKRVIKYWLVYYIKRIGWSYFKRHQ